MNVDRWLTVKELMAYIKIGKSRVYRLLQEGAIPASRIGRSWRIDREEVDAWMRSQRTIPTRADLENDFPMEAEVLSAEKNSLAAPAGYEKDNKEEVEPLTKRISRH